MSSPPTLSRAGLPRQFFHQLSNRSTVLESVEIHMRRVSNSSQHLGPGAPSVRDDPPKELPAGKLLGAAFREVGLCLVPEKNGSFEDSPQAEPGRKSEHDDDLGSKESMMQRAAVVAVHHPIEFGVRRLDPSRIPKVLVQNGRGGGGGSAISLASVRLPARCTRRSSIAVRRKGRAWRSTQRPGSSISMIWPPGSSIREPSWSRSRAVSV